MNAASIIEEIKRLPDDQKEVVIQFTQELRSKRCAGRGKLDRLLKLIKV